MSKMSKRIIKICLIIILCTLIYLIFPFIYKINIMYKNAIAFDNFEKLDNYKYTYERKSDSSGYKITLYKKGNDYRVNNENLVSNYISDSYRMGNDSVVVMEKNKAFQIFKGTDYCVEKGIISAKKFKLDTIKDYLAYTMDSKKEQVKYIWKVCIPSIIPDSIENVEFEGRDCYKCEFHVVTKQSAYYNNHSYSTVYIDKETMLTVYELDKLYEEKNGKMRKLSDDAEIRYIYEKDAVKEEDMTLPDLTEYTQLMNVGN